MSRRDAFRRWWAIHSIPAYVRVLFALHRREQFAVEICQKYQILPGTLYPVLMQAEQMGHVWAWWVETRQSRRMGYFLTPEGAQAVEQVSRLVLLAHWKKLEALFPESEGR